MNIFSKNKLLIFLIILVILLALIDFKNNEYIADFVRVTDTSDFKLVKIKSPMSHGSDKAYYIRFIISKSNYEKYNLHYGERNGQDLYSGAMENIKENYSDTSYICTYKNLIYNTNIKSNLDGIIFNKLLIKINLISIFSVLIYSIYKKYIFKSSNIK